MNSMNFFKGMGAGLLVGACIGAAFAPDKKTGKRAIGKAVKAVSNAVSDISDMMGI